MRSAVRILRFPTLVAVFALLILSCKGNEKSSGNSEKTEVDLSPCFDYTWFRSFEEETDENWKFRHEPWEFPPALGREGMKFNRDNTLEFWAIGPTDIPEQLTGKWYLNGDQLNLVVKGSGITQDFNRTYFVIEANQELLILKLKPE